MKKDYAATVILATVSLVLSCAGEQEKEKRQTTTTILEETMDNASPAQGRTSNLQQEYEAMREDITALGEKIDQLNDEAGESLETAMVELAREEQKLYTKIEEFADRTGDDLAALQSEVAPLLDTLQDNYRQVYVGYIESEIGTWDKKIQQLGNKAGATAGETAEELNVALHELALKQRRLLDNVQKLKISAGDEWENFRRDTEKTMEELVSLYTDTTTNK